MAFEAFISRICGVELCPILFSYLCLYGKYLKFTTKPKQIILQMYDSWCENEYFQRVSWMKTILLQNK